MDMLLESPFLATSPRGVASAVCFDQKHFTTGHDDALSLHISRYMLHGGKENVKKKKILHIIFYDDAAVG